MSALASALVAFQKEAPSLHEDATNGHYNNKYLSLEGLMKQVLPVLTKHDLALMQFPTTIDGLPGLRTKLLHASGEFEEDTMQLALAKSGPQEQGSGLTYARRYAAMAILGLVADEDDDGNKASNGSGGARVAPPSSGSSPAATPAAAPSANGDEYDPTITFGNKHKGENLLAVFKTDPGYVKWIAGEKFDPKTQEQKNIKALAVGLLNGTVTFLEGDAVEAEVRGQFPDYDESIPF